MIIVVSAVAGLMAQLAVTYGLREATEVPVEVRAFFEENRPQVGPVGMTPAFVVVGGVAIHSQANTARLLADNPNHIRPNRPSSRRRVPPNA